jgi:hypothetical protein
MGGKESKSVVPVERIASRIYLIREQKVMLDQDLAELYEVETRTLVQAVKRNPDRFPDDFMFQLSKAEFENLRSQFVTSNWGGRRYAPYAFTEQGIAMLSSVLRSKRAVLINVNIMRTFVRLREMLATNKELARRIDQHDHDIAVLYQYLKQLLEPPPAKKKRPIGYIINEDEDADEE